MGQFVPRFRATGNEHITWNTTHSIASRTDKDTQFLKAWNGASVIIKDQNTKKFPATTLIKAANPILNSNRCVKVPDICLPLLQKGQNLPRVSEDNSIQSIDLSQGTVRSRSLTNAKVYTSLASSCPQCVYQFYCLLMHVCIFIEMPGSNAYTEM